MGVGIHEVRIAQVDDRWELYINGGFVCSADSYCGIVNELWEVSHG